MVFLVTDMLGGAIPVLGIAWLLRLVTRTKASNGRAAFYSIAGAAMIGFLLRGFADGENGIASRAANILSFDQFVPILGSTVIAGIFLFLWWFGKRNP